MTLGRVFAPQSVAVVGASANPAKRGHQILRALGQSGYDGAVHAVNPAGGRILGRQAVPSVADLPEGVDLAVLCTPAATAPSLVRACGDRGVGGVLALAVGFGETGAEGKQLEDDLRAAGKAAGVRIVGPNTSGLLNLPAGLNLIGAQGIRPGGIALLVQSGNVALALMNEIVQRTHDGVSICCGLGNQIDITFGEALEHLANDEATQAVIVHVEGLRDGRGFLRAASAVAQRKPVIVLKSGRTAEGADTALSHTGAVAGPYDRLRAGMRQAGIVEVARTDELVPVASALAWQPARHGLDNGKGGGIAILSDGGGQNVLAVDFLTAQGASLARLSPETQAALRRVLGPAAAVRNPVDVAGAADADPSAFPRALDILAQDNAVGLALIVGLFGGYAIRFADQLAAAETQAAQSMAAAMQTASKGLVAHSIYASQASAPLDALRCARVPVIESLEAACRAAAELQRRATETRRTWPPSRQAQPDPAGSAMPDKDARPALAAHPALAAPRPTLATAQHTLAVPHPALAAAQADRRATLTELEARQLLADTGVVFAPAQLVHTPEEAASATAALGGPVALKLLSKHVVHKSDAGGVVLNVAGSAHARRAFQRIAQAAAEHARAHGLPSEHCAALVSPMLPPPLAELLVGACRDPQLGPVLTVGAGGLWTETLRDVSHRVLPIAQDEPADMLAETTIGAILAGGRGRPAACMNAIAKAVAAVSQCILTHPGISEVEINPLFAYADKAVAVDARAALGTNYSHNGHNHAAKRLGDRRNAGT